MARELSSHTDLNIELYKKDSNLLLEGQTIKLNIPNNKKDPFYSKILLIKISLADLQRNIKIKQRELVQRLIPIDPITGELVKKVVIFTSNLVKKFYKYKDMILS